MSTPWSWSGGSRRQADEVGWSQKVMEMGQGTDKDKKGKKGGCTMTCSQFSHQIGCSSAELSLNTTFNAKHFTESVPTHCFNFEGISLSPEFGLHTCMDHRTEIHGHK